VNTCSMKFNIAESYISTGNYEKADWWLQQLETECSKRHGEKSQLRFQDVLYFAPIYLHRGLWDKAEPLFKNALEMVPDVLKPDNPVEEQIAKCLKTKRWTVDRGTMKDWFVKWKRDDSASHLQQSCNWK